MGNEGIVGTSLFLGSGATSGHGSVRIAGASSGSRDTARIEPRDSGRSWQTENVHPDHGCGDPPATSAETAARCTV